MAEKTSPTEAPATRVFWRRVGMIAALGLLLRLLVVMTIPTQPVSDFLEYFQHAQNIAHFGKYQLEIEKPDANRPPLYPLWLAAIIGVSPAELTAVKLGNCILGILTVFIGAGLARKLSGDRAGIAAALIFALFPRLLLMPLLVASENLFSPFLLLFVSVAATRWLLGAREVFEPGEASNSPRRFPWLSRSAARLAVVTGLLIGLLALTRTIAYVLALVWLAGMLFTRVRWRAILVELFLILAVEHAVMLPWAIRNQRAIGRFTFLSTIGGIGLYVGNNPHATGDWAPWRKDLERARPGILSRGSAEIDEAAKQEAVRWICENPGRAARLFVKRLWILVEEDTVAAWWAIYAKRVTVPYPGGDVLPGPHLLKNHYVAVSRTLRLADLLLLVCAAGGLWILLWRAHKKGSALDRALAAGYLAGLVYFPLFSALICMTGRYRWPTEDLCVPIAAVFLTSRAPQRNTPL